MRYILKHEDKEILSFSLEQDAYGLNAKDLDICEKNREFLPLDLVPSERGILSWLSHRFIPSNRAYVSNLVSRLGFNERDKKALLDVSKALSLNDVYWIVPERSDRLYRDYNLYEHRFSRILGLIAFTGHGTSTNRSSLRSSPEFTTNGMLAKCWRRIDSKILLYKSGTVGFSNSGNEPYSEFYAAQIAETMGINHVGYNLSRWKKMLCSTCELFTSKDESFISIGRLVKEGGIRCVEEYIRNLGDSFYQDYIDMLVFDAVIMNEDRHFGNFGVMVDNSTNTIIRMAPCFDHGLALLPYLSERNLDDIEAYADTRRPAAYDDFYEFLKGKIGTRQKEKLRRLIGFRFKKHSRYNLSKERLALLEEAIQKRVQKILEIK